MSKRWTWQPENNPSVLPLFAADPETTDWCDDLERAAADAVTGKVLCVCAALAIARAILARHFLNHVNFAEAARLLDLAEAWVDDPTDIQFNQMTVHLFNDDTTIPNDSHPLKVTWCALRVATSTVGNYEAGWALSMVVECATNADVSAFDIAQRTVESRSNDFT